MREKRTEVDERLFDILIFLATSARGCIDEPPLYGPFRLVDALSRLIDLYDHVPGLKKDAFLIEIKAEIDGKKFLVMNDPEGFKKFLDELVH
ncbi:MAG: DUF6092 family protein, partial [Hadesarchaea archaeon]|nr:DUF6092 family protein [Hadesarchaea archaeon]